MDSVGNGKQNISLTRVGKRKGISKQRKAEALKCSTQRIYFKIETGEMLLGRREKLN